MSAARRAPIRVLLAESQTLLRAGVRALLAEQADFTPPIEATDAATALAEARGGGIDVAVVALGLAGGPPFETIAALVRETGSPVVALADDGSPDALLAAVDAGARAVVTRRASGASLVEAIRSVAGGRRWFEPDLARLLDRRRGATFVATAPEADARFRWAELTEREREVAGLAASGLAYREVAARLAISDHTVRNHLRRVYDKLNIGSRLELVLAGAKARAVSSGHRAKIGS